MAASGNMSNPQAEAIRMAGTRQEEIPLGKSLGYNVRLNATTKDVLVVPSRRRLQGFCMNA